MESSCNESSYQLDDNDNSLFSDIESSLELQKERKGQIHGQINIKNDVKNNKNKGSSTSEHHNNKKDKKHESKESYISNKSINEDFNKFWIYVELKSFYMMKDGKSLTLSNHLGKVYTLSGYSECMVENWSNRIKDTINFP